MTDIVFEIVEPEAPNFFVPVGPRGPQGPPGAAAPATHTSLGSVIVGSDFEVDASGMITLIKADSVEADNTRPVTSAAVYTEIGNIEALLRAI